MTASKRRRAATIEPRLVNWRLWTSEFDVGMAIRVASEKGTGILGMQVESIYSHDGLRDSLTSLAAPPLFYEELRRELARAKRRESKIVLIRMVLRERLLAVDEEIIKFDPRREILEFGQLLRRASRAEDVCARVGEREFLNLIHGDQIQSESIVLRIIKNWSLEDRRLKLFTSCVTSTHGELGLDILNRLDLIELVEAFD